MSMNALNRQETSQTKVTEKAGGQCSSKRATYCFNKIVQKEFTFLLHFHVETHCYMTTSTPGLYVCECSISIVGCGGAEGLASAC